jgi:hypothetical protein
MNRISIRLETPEIESSLAEINDKPATAAQTVIELFTYMRQATIREIRGLFTPNELTSIAYFIKSTKPAVQVMCAPSFLITGLEEAEKSKSAVSNYDVELKALISKIERLTTAQSAILQLEISSYWELKRIKPVNPNFMNSPVPASEIISSRNRQKASDLDKLIKIFS